MVFHAGLGVVRIPALGSSPAAFDESGVATFKRLPSRTTWAIKRKGCQEPFFYTQCLTKLSFIATCISVRFPCFFERVHHERGFIRIGGMRRDG